MQASSRIHSRCATAVLFDVPNEDFGCAMKGRSLPGKLTSVELLGQIVESPLSRWVRTLYARRLGGISEPRTLCAAATPRRVASKI